jgi:AcrR family transcriptional regulator
MQESQPTQGTNQPPAAAAGLAARATRRSPVQGRSHETVQRVLDAASRLLETMAPEAITTNRIAAEADVSVGGLYRFFPDKQAIIDEIAVRRQKEFEEYIAVRFMEDLPSNGPAFFNGIIDAYVGFLDSHADFRTLALGHYISLETRKREAQPDVGTAAMLKQFMVHYLGMEDSEELSLKLGITVEVGERLLSFAYEQPSLNERAKVIAQLKTMLAGYLFAPGQLP